MRIWHQGFVDFNKVPIYRKSFELHLSQVIDKQAEVTIHGLLPGTYGAGMTPIDALRHPYVEKLLASQICEAALTAEHNRYDAVAVNCFFDPALREARSIVDIPVVSLFETCMLTAFSLGNAVGMLALNEDQCEKHRELIAQYDMGNRFVGTLPVNPPIDEYMLEGPPEATGAISEGTLKACHALIERGADVIIPGDGVLNDFIWRRQLAVPGVVLMDAAAVLIHHACYLAGLRRDVGITVSRRNHYAQPTPAKLEHIRSFTGQRTIAESEFSGVGTVTRS
jgi:Asp/Glu/hydantoin racemase